MKTKVPIANILYLYSYIWDEVKETKEALYQASDQIYSENLLCEWYLRGVEPYLKRGLYCEYENQYGELRVLKGKIDFKASFLSLKNGKAYCIYDELETNILLNQIFKATADRLYRTKGIDKEKKHRLRQVLVHFSSVALVSLDQKLFSISFHKQNKKLKVLYQLCHLIYELTMISDKKGNFYFIDVLDNDEKMQHVFEKFIYRFYEYHLKKNTVYYQKKVEWNTLKDNYLPAMYLDTVIETKEESLIIDTKYYPNFYEVRNYGNIESKKLISSNLYQMYTYMCQYVSNKLTRGILLYPQSWLKEACFKCYPIPIMNKDCVLKAQLEIRTIDLCLPYQELEKKLLEIVKIQE